MPHDAPVYHIMFVIGDLELLLHLVPVEEITEQEHGASFLDGVCHELDGLSDVGQLACGLEVEQFAYDIEYMLSSLLGWYEFLDLVGEEYHPDFVLVLDGRKRECSRHFGSHLAFGLADGAEIEASGHIDHEYDSQFSFLLEDLDIWSVETSRDVPVDVPDIVSVLIFPDLRECHTSSLEGRMILTREDVLRQSSGFDLNLPYLF